MDASTRPSRISRQKRSLQRLHLAAFVFSGIVALGFSGQRDASAATTENASEADTTATISPSSAHEVAITIVRPGTESASFSAHLTDASLSPAKNVSWRVRNSDGEIVLDTQATRAETPLRPGYYQIEARYGAIRLDETFTVLDGNSIALNFILNAGALRILPRIKGLASPEITSRSLVYGLTGMARGMLVTETAIPGEIISLTAGHYRIESRLGSGNAVAVTDVKVKPGVMSAVEIDHRAGLARLAYVGAPTAEVTWDIREGDHYALQSIRGLSASLVLRPGDYTAIAKVGDETLSASFRIEEGQERDIFLGN